MYGEFQAYQGKINWVLCYYKLYCQYYSIQISFDYLFYSIMRAQIAQVVQEKNKSCLKEGFRRVYTSHNQQVPFQLSYQNIKLANFIELQLTDLWDSLQNISEENYKNQLKQCLSRSYNAFHEMQKLYNDLGMNFLYSQSKKLISSYGIIFVYLMSKIEKSKEKNEEAKAQIKYETLRKVNVFQQQVKQNIQNIKLRKADKETKVYKRLKGIHLFNQSYARCIDYDIQSFRQLRQKIKQKQKTEEEQKLSQLEQQRKFKKEVIDELNDFNHLKVDGEQLYVFLSRQRHLDQLSKSISLGDQLQKIAAFFKESQHQALEFLRKQKNLQTFHQLTQGFNSIMQDYQNNKNNQLFFVKDKIRQIFEFIKTKNTILQKIINQKQKQIIHLKQLLNNKKHSTAQAQVQTYYNFDDQIRQLYRRIVENQMMNQRLKAYITKTNEQDKKEKDILINQISIKQSSLRQIKQVLDDKINQIAKVQRKINILNENNKNKNIKDPIQMFNSFNEQLKKMFVDQLKQQGFFSFVRAQQRHSSSFKRNTKSSNKSPDLLSPNVNQGQRKDHAVADDHYERKIKRQSSFIKRSTSNFAFRQSESKLANQIDSLRKSGHLGFVVQQLSQQSSSNPSEYQKSKQNSIYQRQGGQTTNGGFKSKKVISIRPNQNDGNTEKIRVFDLQDKNGYLYSQKNVEFQSSSKIQSKSFRNLAAKDKFYSKNNSNASSMNRALNKGEDYHLQQQNFEGENNQAIINLNENGQKSKLKSKSRSKNEGKDYFQQVTENQLQESNQFAAQSRVRKSKRQKTSNKRRDYDENNQMEDYFQENQQKSQQFIQQRKKRTHRISCELSIQECSLKDMTNQKENIKPLTKSRRKKQNKYSFTNQFNLTISQSPSPLLVSLNNINKLEQISRDKINLAMMQRNLQIKSQIQKHIKQQKQKFKTTTRKKIVEQPQRASKDLENRRTRTNMKNMSLNNTFHKQALPKMANGTIKQQSPYNKGINNTLTNFRHDQINIENESKSNNARRNLSKTKSLLRVADPNSTFHSEQLRTLLEQQFGQQQAVIVSRMAASVDEFKQRIMRLHQGKCGKNCKHLQRYVDIYLKLKKLHGKTKRQIVKLHVQNMNERLGSFQNDNISALPAIKK